MFLKIYITVKNRVTSLFLLISLSCFSSSIYSQTTTVFNNTSTWTCPVGVSSITVESWGAGGAGGGVSTGGSVQGGGGGGGGAYTIATNVPVTPGTTYNVVVGLGGVGSTGNGTDGNSSLFSTNVAIANGGRGGQANNAAGGAGGTGSFNGGNGYQGNSGTPGGGGGSGGTSSKGNNATGSSGAAAVTGGGSGGDGPTGSGAKAGGNGNTPGGGGAGAKKGSGGGSAIGGNGADGQLAITYTQPTYKSQILSVNFGTSPWCSGSTRTVTVQVKNVGTATWTDSNPDINIGLKWNVDADYGGAPSYIARQDAGNLAPGATGTYTFLNVVPPIGATTENLTADVVYEGVSWFGNNNGGVGPGNVVFTAPLITVTTTPSITAQPITTQTVCEGSAISMSVVASGIVTYQWRKGITPLTDGGTISGSGTATLNISSVAVADAAANYNVVITNSCGSVTSNNSNLSVNSAPVIPSNPSSNSPNCNSVTLSMVGTPPGGVSWFWQTLVGGTSTTNSLATYNVSTSGTYYLRAQNTTTGCWSVSSGSAAVIVNLAPAQPSAISGPGSVCSGSTQNYSVTNVAGVTYTWSVPAGWSISSGQGTNSISILSGASGGTITVIPSNGCGNGFSVNLAVGVDQALYWAGLGTTIIGGTTGTDFNTAANWSTNSTTFVAAGIYPGACNDVIINIALSTTSTSTILFSQPATTIKSLNFSLNGSTTTSTIYESGLRLNNQSLTILGTTTLYAQNNTVNRTTQVTLDAISAGSLFTFVGDLTTNATNPGGGSGECIVYPFSNPVGTINMGKFVVKGNCTFSGVGDDAHPQLNKPTTVVFDGTGTQTITNNNSNGYPIYLGFTTQIGEVNSPTVILTGSNALGFQTINNLIINNNATLDITANQSLNRYIAGTPGTFTMNAGSKLFVRGNSGGAAGSNFPTNFSTAYSLDASSTVEYTTPNGVNQTVFGPITYGNLILTNSSGSGSSIKTSAGNMTIGGNITVNSYTTFNMLAFTGNRSSIGGTLSVAANSFLKLAGSSGGAGTSNFPNNFSTVSFVPTSTVEYNGAGAQSVYSTTYGNLILSTGNTKTASGSLNVANDLTINTTALFNMGSFAHTLTGNWYNNVALASTIPSTSTFLLNGSVAQTLGGSAASAFNNLSINNSTGVSLLQDQTINGTLNLIAGNLRLTTKNLTIAGTAAVSGSPFSSSKMIVADGGGEMRKTFSSTGSYLFPVGDETGTADYSPITLNYTSGTFGGAAYSGVKVTNAKHPNNASTTDFLKRYWTVSNSAITSPSFNATGTYVPADIAGTESSISSAKFNGTLPWVKYSVLSAYTLTANAITNTGSGIALSGITNQVLAVNITGGGVTICKGNSVSLGSSVSNNGTGTFTYSWAPGTGLSSTTIANPVATPTSTTTYILTVTDANGITASANTTITVTIPPSATISYAGTPFCSTAGLGNVTLTGTAGGNYSSTAGLSINSSTGQINIATSTAGPYTVTYTVAASGGCALFSTTTLVTINTAPSASISYAGNPFCSNAGLINVSRTGTAGGSYSSTAGLSINSATGQINTSSSTAGIYTVTYTIAASGGCALFSTTTSVTITAMPSATISYAGTPFCSTAGSGNVTLTGTAGGNYSSTAGLTINSSTGQINIATSTAGPYTVTYTVAASGGCSLFSTTTSVTIQSQPTITANNSGPVCVQNIITLGASSISGATYSWSGPAGFSSSSQNPNFVYDASKAGVYSVVATTSGGCQSNTAITTVSGSSVSGLWTGAISTDWSDGNNWCSGIIPTSSTDVTIPSPVLNMPLLADSRDCNNISVASGDTLTVGVGGTLNIYGAISTSNKNIKALNGTIVMSGSIAQTITTNSFYNNAINNLVINNSSVSGVSLGGAVDVYGALTFSGTGKKLETNDTLTLKSNINGTAWVGDLTGNTVSGKVTVERYISQYKAWRLLSIPTFSTQTIKEAWQENSTGGSSNPVPGFGTQITSPSASWAADGFDLKSASPSMKTYDAASDSWIGVPTTNTTLIPNINGYLLYVRGDRLATGTASPVTSTTLRTKGKLYKGTLPALTAIPDTYMSVGNPYASPIDFAQLTIGNGIDNKFYAFDPFIYGYYGYGGYQVISAAYGWKPVPGGSPVYPTGIANSTIQSGEAFFVHATTVPSLLPANYNVVFSENAKISGDDLISFARPQLGEGVKDEIQSFAVTLYTGPTQSDVVADGNAAVFNDSYAAIVDRDDARKITASGENFDLKRNGALLAIEARPSLTVNDTLFYNMTKLAKKNYQLRFVANNLEQTGLTPVLIDKYLNTRATLSISGNSALNITVNGDAASSLANRFMVVFAPLNILPVTFVNIQAARKDSGILVSWNIANEKNIRNYDIERSSDGIHFSKIGNAVAKNISQYAWLDKNATIGDNYYRVSANDIDGDIKRSNIVKVKAEIVTSSFSIYPNPVKDNIIHVYFKGQKAGKYNAQLINADGKILMSKIINLSEGNSQESIKPDTHIAHGIYQLQISNGSGSVYKMQVLF